MLKSLLLGKYWEEGLLWLMLTAREVTQETTGFSSKDLVFAHSVRGPLAVLKMTVKDDSPPKNLFGYGNGFWHSLYITRQMAKQKLAASQGRSSAFIISKLSGTSLVLVIRCSLATARVPFKARFTGPHTVMKPISQNNYLISTP